MKEKENVGYLKLEQLDYLSALIGQEINNVTYHYWKSNSGFSSLDWIELAFDNRILTLTSGQIAEDIVVLSHFDVNERRQELLKTNPQQDTKIVSTNQNKNPEWIPLLKNKIIQIGYTDYNGYCNNSVILETESFFVEIFAGIDNVNVLFNKTLFDTKETLDDRYKLIENYT